jgi:hypothetical protein
MAFTDQDRKTLEGIDKILTGDPSNREDLGLLGDVKENTGFRKQHEKYTYKLNWTLVLALIGLCTAIIAQGFN